MNADQRAALSELHLDSTLTKEHVWTSAQAHVPELHASAQEMISQGVEEARASDGPSPIGVALVGRSGAGKTHLLGWLRRLMQQEGGYFFLTNLSDGRGFWPNVAEALRQGLDRDDEDGQSQLVAFLRDLAAVIGLPSGVRDTMVGDAPLSPDVLDVVVDALVSHDRQVGQECQDAARALVLSAAKGTRTNAVGYDYLTSSGDMTNEDRATWGFRSRSQQPQRVVEDVSTLLALTGPSVIAVDQIDTLVARSTRSSVEAGQRQDSENVDAQLAEIADGLMLLREGTRRTVTVLACLPHSWEEIRTGTSSSVPDRFRPTRPLSRIPSTDVGRRLVEARLAATYRRIGFTPPHPTWPIAESAFGDEIKEYTPRQLLNLVDHHIAACRNGDEVRELTSFRDEPETTVPDAVPRPTPGVDLAPLDARFAELKRAADIRGPLSPDEENRLMPALLRAGLTAWVAERGTERKSWSVDPLPGATPPLHARLRHTLDEETEDEEHWSFRAIAAPHYRATQSRFDKAWAASGIGGQVDGRGLVLIRNTPWPSGPGTERRLADLEAAGGVSVPITENDLRTFTALSMLIDERDPSLQDWLTARRPACGTELLAAVLPAAPAAPRPPDPTLSPTDQPVQNPGSTEPVWPDTDWDPDAASRPEPSTADVPTITVGETMSDHTAVRIPLESLRKHVVIFAGSGSGKTVLIRRLVEECALLGVSSIVLDPNNDLAQLGDPWPADQAGWGPADPAKAREYLAETDVVVWTPGHATGRPLAFQPLPDIAGVADNADEFRFAVQAAVASLAPRAKVTGRTAKADMSKAVLNGALAHYARQGGRSLDGFIDVLADLPEGVSRLAAATGIAADLAETLKAAMVNDTLFGGAGTPLDPGALLAPAPGKRARVSVISLDGLPSLEERQGFVNQLQMELFAWVKRNPAGDRPLGGLLVMDEAHELAPSGSQTASTESSIRLASQARKYGLGLVLATQAPKAIHNRITGNATTQFFGRLNAPTHIAAAGELARAKGRDLPDLGRLAIGQFYVTGEGISFQKVLTPLCLTHHPRSPLTTDEVLDRARRQP